MSTHWATRSEGGKGCWYLTSRNEKKERKTSLVGMLCRASWWWSDAMTAYVALVCMVWLKAVTYWSSYPKFIQNRCESLLVRERKDSCTNFRFLSNSLILSVYIFYLTFSRYSCILLFLPLLLPLLYPPPYSLSPSLLPSLRSASAASCYLCFFFILRAAHARFSSDSSGRRRSPSLYSPLSLFSSFVPFFLS